MTPPIATPAYWSERLSLLLGTLTTELHGQPPGTLVARRLRSGYSFSLTRDPDGRRRARISVEDRPGGEAGWKRFHEEIDVMAQHLAISGWDVVTPVLAPGEVYRGAMVEFAEKTVG